MARTRTSASPLRLEKTTPQIPHTRLFDFRRGEKRSAGAHKVGPQAKPRNVQSLVGVPAKQYSEQE
jgi:hypothetical protein